MVTENHNQTIQDQNSMPSNKDDVIRKLKKVFIFDNELNEVTFFQFFT